MYYFCLFADVDVPVCRKTCTKPAVERILEFGRELYSMSQRLTVDKNSSETNQKMLEVSGRRRRRCRLITINALFSPGCI
jgi:hypothetical protein